MEIRINEKENTKGKTGRQIKPNTLTYDDILAKMGMYVHDGKLHLGKNTEQPCNSSVKMECSKVKCNRLQENIKNVAVSFAPPPEQQNSYIYNKYFKNHQQETISNTIAPRTPEEFNNVLKQKIIEKRLQRLRLSQIKSSKLIMPTENIQVSPEQNKTVNPNENKWFGFSKVL